MERAERHNRRSIRLKGYDYTQDGAYFVTVCTHGRTHAFGAVIGAEMRLNEYGHEVANCWTCLEEQYQYVYIDVWIVMPDHTHAIIVIENAHHNGATHDGSNATNPNIAHRDVTNTNHPCRGGSRTAQRRTALGMGTVDGSAVSMYGSETATTQRKPLGRLIGAFKTVSTKHINDLRDTRGGQLWQRNYHERVICNSLSLRAFRRYIANNPVLWEPR